MGGLGLAVWLAWVEGAAAVEETAASSEPVAAPVAPDVDDPLGLGDTEPPPPPVILREIPPRFSWEVDLIAGLGNLPQFAIPLWMGLGVRGGWGKNFDRHRVGFGMSIALEGQIGIEWSNNFEPAVIWDFVGPRKLWLGASLGPDLLINTRVDPASGAGTKNEFDIAPSAAFRIGFSQPWSLLSQRFHVGLEGKFRMLELGQHNYPQGVVSVVIGSGRGY